MCAPIPLVQNVCSINVQSRAVWVEKVSSSRCTNMAALAPAGSTYLDVPYADKSNAKAKRARWHKAADGMCRRPWPTASTAFTHGSLACARRSARQRTNTLNCTQTACISTSLQEKRAAQGRAARCGTHIRHTLLATAPYVLPESPATSQSGMTRIIPWWIPTTWALAGRIC